MSKKYTYPDSRVVTTASALVVLKFEVNLDAKTFRLAYREIDAAGQIVSSPIIEFGDLVKADLFVSVAGGLPGDTFEEKLLSPQALAQLLPFVPAGGVVEDA